MPSIYDLLFQAVNSVTQDTKIINLNLRMAPNGLLIVFGLIALFSLSRRVLTMSRHCFFLLRIVTDVDSLFRQGLEFDVDSDILIQLC